MIDPASARDGQYDLLVRDGEIAAVERAGTQINLDDANLVDASGYWIVPGPLHRRNLAVAHQQVILAVECANGIDHPSASEQD